MAAGCPARAGSDASMPPPSSRASDALRECCRTTRDAIANVFKLVEQGPPSAAELAKLSPAERHLVNRLVAFFATGDSIVANNLAGLAGGGISLFDAKNVVIRHNTIANNDSTATAGTAFAAAGDLLQSAPQPGAGVVARGHSPALLAYQRPNNEDFSDAKLSDNIV